jgi:hypothetical protein
VLWLPILKVMLTNAARFPPQLGGLVSYDSSDDSGSDGGDAGKKRPLAGAPSTPAAAAAPKALVAYHDSDDSDVGSPLSPPSAKKLKSDQGGDGSNALPALVDAAVAVAADALPQQPCDPEVQADFQRLFAAHGSGFAAYVRAAKDFNNPYALEEVASYFGVDPVASCYPRYSFDPHGFPTEDYYEHIAAAQRALGDSRSAPAPAPAFPL